MGWLGKFFKRKLSTQDSLIEATKKGDAKEVHRILVNALDPQAKDEALSVARRCGYKDIVRDLC